MQTMPVKTRTVLTVGAVLLVVVLGALALWTGTRLRHEAPPAGPNQVLNQESAELANSVLPNEAGVSAAPAGSETAEAAAAGQVPKTYTVQPGDTLASISLKTYGDANGYWAIERANQLVDPNHIVADDQLKMPSALTLEAVNAILNQ